MQIVVGDEYTILIGEKIYVWGRNNYGQLGLGDTEDRNSPQELSLCGIKSVSCGAHHTIALMANDQIYVWGTNYNGQLGLGDYVSVQGYCETSPLKTTFHSKESGEALQIQSIVCGGFHTVAMTYSSKIYIWGRNEYGALGLGDTEDRSVPEELKLDNIISISCGRYHTIALTCCNDLYAWGLNDCGQLGLGDYIDRLTPKKLKLKFEFPLSNIKSISCGTYHTIALMTSGSLYSWGFDDHGQLGVGISDTNNQIVPHKINLDGIKLVDCGSKYTAPRKYTQMCAFSRGAFPYFIWKTFGLKAQKRSKNI